MRDAPPDLTAIADLAQRLSERLRKLVGVEGSVPLHEPEFRGNEWTFLKDCLDTGWVSSVGSYVDRFEREIASICGTSHGVAVVNGTAALHLALHVAGVRSGDEVLAPAFTFVATANAISHAGGIPHFIDCDRSSLGVSADALRVHLTNLVDRRSGSSVNARTGRRISALIVMHAFGHPADMDAINAVATEFSIPVVEDATEALGSQYKGRPCGGLSRVGALSFNGNKIVTTGGGGAIVTDDPDIARRAKHLATTAKLPHAWAFVHDEIGWNYRMPNLNAALGCAQLGQLAGFLDRKRRLAERYISGFADFPELKPFVEPKGTHSNYWLNAILLDCHWACARDTLLHRVNADGLMCRPAWTPMHRLPIYSNCPRADLSVTDDIVARLINVPSSARLADDE